MYKNFVTSNSALIGLLFLSSSAFGDCYVGCRHDAERVMEQCKYDADTTADDYMSNSGEIDVLDGGAMLRRTQQLNRIATEQTRCSNRVNAEHRRCNETCTAYR